MARKKLTAAELKEALTDLPKWQAAASKLQRKYKFADFAESLAFVNRIGALAEAADHHPDIAFGWGYADITLTTHDAGGITDADLRLAKQIDGIG